MTLYKACFTLVIAKDWIKIVITFSISVSNWILQENNNSMFDTLFQTYYHIVFTLIITFFNTLIRDFVLKHVLQESAKDLNKNVTTFSNSFSTMIVMRNWKHNVWHIVSRIVSYCCNITQHFLQQSATWLCQKRASQEVPKIESKLS